MGNEVNGVQPVPPLQEGRHLAQAVAAGVQDHGVCVGGQSLLQHLVAGDTRFEEDNLADGRAISVVGTEHLKLAGAPVGRRGQAAFQPLQRRPERPSAYQAGTP